MSPPRSTTWRWRFCAGLFVDSYNSSMLGSQDALRNLQAVVRKLHGDLLIGTVGDWLIELAAGLGIVLVVSGMYLWWPRSTSRAGVLWPRVIARDRQRRRARYPVRLLQPASRRAGRFTPVAGIAQLPTSLGAQIAQRPRCTANELKCFEIRCRAACKPSRTSSQ